MTAARPVLDYWDWVVRMNLLLNRVLSIAIAAGVSLGVSVCPCLAMAQEAAKAPPPAQPAPAKPKCGHCTPVPVAGVAEAGTRAGSPPPPAEPCPHCKSPQASDRSSTDRHEITLNPASIALLAGPSVSAPVALAVAAIRLAESVPIPPLLHDLFHQSCLLTV